jgi:hypothetical protein
MIYFTKVSPLFYHSRAIRIIVIIPPSGRRADVPIKATSGGADDDNADAVVA